MLLHGKMFAGHIPAPFLSEPAHHLLVEAWRALAAQEADGGEGGGPGPVPAGVAEPFLQQRRRHWVGEIHAALSQPCHPRT